MKQLIIISGPMGVGKTTAARGLLDVLPHSVMLDGDWCWEQGGHYDICDETKKLVADNIVHLLRGFLTCSRFESVIFSWVLNVAEAREAILSSLSDLDFTLFDIALLCSTEELAHRVGARGGSAADKDRAVKYLEGYPLPGSVVLDTTGLSRAHVVDGILRIITIDAPRCRF